MGRRGEARIETGAETAGAHPPEPIAALVARLKVHDRLKAELAHAEVLPGQPARTVAFDDLATPLPEAIRQALAAGGVVSLFSHQAEGLAAILAGKDTLLTTPTASGKSLVFQLPPLLAAVRGEPGKALFVYPLKALGQDQHGKMNALAAAAGLDPARDGAMIFDGDTPRALRAKIKRRPPRVLITNPDMLHFGILGGWTGWGELLGDLRWIVLDELHTYRGIFGCHVHHVIQRLLRLARAERAGREVRGGEPVIVASSATAANAADFAQTLVGRPFHAVGESGAPRSDRHVLLFRPEASPYTTALELMLELLGSGAKTIVFTKARRITELLYSWLRRREPKLARRVASYRSGFLPEERRKIEARLFSGELDGVIATSALEMGIDVGGLDACVLVGYPGSVMATWQRSGRAGRGDRDSLTVLVALPDALDQYFLDHPRELLDRPCEPLIVDPGNEPVARAHLVCAAAEMPLSPRRDGAPGGYLARHGDLVARLVAEKRLLATAGGDEILSPVHRPHRQVDLRGTGAGYEIVDGASGELIGQIDGVRVLHECHPGAVYLHAGRQYLVETLDLDRRHVVVVRGDVEYFTTPLTEKETEILEVLAERADPTDDPADRCLQAGLGRLRVTERVVGFERKRIQGQEVLGQEALDLPSTRFETVGLWWRAPRAFEETLRQQEEHFLGSLHATEHAAISLFPVLALCDRGDIGGISFHRHPQVESGAVFIYDGHPGGVGIAARGFADLPELLARVSDLLEGCPCETGCPSCIQSPKCGNGNRPLDKRGAARVIRLLLGREEPIEPIQPMPPIRLLEELEPAEPSPSHHPAPSNPRHPELREGSGRGTAAPSQHRPELAGAPEPAHPVVPAPPRVVSAPPPCRPGAPPCRPERSRGTWEGESRSNHCRRPPHRPLRLRNAPLRQRGRRLGKRPPHGHLDRRRLHPRRRPLRGLPRRAYPRASRPPPLRHPRRRLQHPPLRLPGPLRLHRRRLRPRPPHPRPPRRRPQRPRPPRRLGPPRPRNPRRRQGRRRPPVPRMGPPGPPRPRRDLLPQRRRAPPRPLPPRPPRGLPLAQGQAAGKGADRGRVVGIRCRSPKRVRINTLEIRFDDRVDRRHLLEAGFAEHLAPPGLGGVMQLLSVELIVESVSLAVFV